MFHLYLREKAQRLMRWTLTRSSLRGLLFTFRLHPLSDSLSCDHHPKVFVSLSQNRSTGTTKRLVLQCALHRMFLL